MLKKKFGSTGEELSYLGFGCMRLPQTDPKDAAKIDYDLGTAMVRKAIDRGVNYVDTAWPYHGDGGRKNPGESEPFVAYALRNGYREKVKLATKLPSWVIESRADMNRILDAQLKRLDTGHIDFYLVHNLNTADWPRLKHLKVREFMDEALKDGRIKYAGFSFHDRYDLFEDIITSYDWALAQIQYNYLDVNYQAGERGLKKAAERGVGVSVMEPLRGGFLTGHMPEEMADYLHSIRPEWSLADWGLRWLWRQPEVGIVLSGMSEMAHVDANLDIADTADQPFTEKDLEAIAKVREFFQKRIKANCTSCGYCLPCPSGVNIPKNFIFLNDYHLSDADLIKTRSKYYFNAQMSSGESYVNCIHCRECEEKCPQHLPISDLMDDMAATFG